MTVTYSVVIPLKDEEKAIGPLITEVEKTLDSLGEPWELICIDDGSKDATLPLLEKLLPNKPYLRLIKFDQNYGQSSAFAEGFDRARGKFVITLDGDGQNDPADIPKLLEIIEKYDLVCGVRTKRRDRPAKRLISRLANQIRSRVCKDGMDDTGCSLKVFRTDSLKKIKIYQGLHRFLPALFLIEGLRVAQIPVNHRERATGVSKYHFRNRSFNTLLDLFAVWWMQKRQLRHKIERELP